MKIVHKANFKGYITILRSIQYLLKDKTINFTQLGAFISFAAQADWDSRHPHYSVIIRDDAELAREWGCSVTTVSRKRKELIKIGVLYEKDGLTRIKNFSMFELKWLKTLANVPPTITKTFYAMTLDEVAESVDSIAKMHQVPPQNDTQSSNGPSKGELSSSDEDVDVLNDYSDEESEENELEGGE